MTTLTISVPDFEAHDAVAATFAHAMDRIIHSACYAGETFEGSKRHNVDLRDDMYPSSGLYGFTREVYNNGTRYEVTTRNAEQSCSVRYLHIWVPAEGGPAQIGPMPMFYCRHDNQSWSLPTAEEVELVAQRIQGVATSRFTANLAKEARGSMKAMKALAKALA